MDVNDDIVSRTGQNGTVMVDPRHYTNVLVRSFNAPVVVQRKELTVVQRLARIINRQYVDMYPILRFALT